MVPPPALGGTIACSLTLGGTIAQTGSTTTWYSLGDYATSVPLVGSLFGPFQLAQHSPNLAQFQPNYVLNINFKIFTKLNKSISLGFFWRDSDDLLTNFRWSLGNVLADSWQALGLHDDILGEFQWAPLTSSWTSRSIPIELSTNVRTSDKLLNSQWNLVLDSGTSFFFMPWSLS